MFHPKTLFVVGAGASSEVGLPLGYDLVQKIAWSLQNGRDIQTGNYIDNSPELLEVIASSYPGQQGQLLRVAQNMSTQLNHADSIDAFLNDFSNRQDITALGKLSIADTIAKAEINSGLNVDRRDASNTFQNNNQVAKSWFPEFFRQLKSGIGIKNIGDLFNNVAVVCFNYDRCIEQYLYYAIREYYRLQPVEVISILRTLKIVKPYGEIGAFEIDQNTGFSYFGKKLRGPELQERAKHLLTVYESGAETDAINTIKSLMEDSSQVIFLGFGYHPLNMSLLAPTSARSGSMPNIYATGLKIPKEQRDELQGRIAKLFLKDQPVDSFLLSKVHLELGMNCQQLLHSYSMLLTK